ncbi:hypothetical protein GCM10011577_01140 [Pseudarthrobacter polychromogenes]|uniref:O-antigen ligase domain-containing protein n=2 Tax=Pseudarthrobacter polychromogenes TaxID=1676 RepID=A0ABQ1XD96_9MICC|nr:hypothetical protein GCM10011577_01140 [Pseudarthrobacter polychromogenes]
MALGLIVGYGALRLGALPIGYERLGSGLMFPFSLTYGNSSDGVTRFLGLGREPGMGAIFIGYAFFAMPAVKRAILYRGVLLVALMGTLSTAGIGLFAVALGLYFVFGSKKRNLIVRAAAIGASVWAINVALYDTRFGFLSKIETVSNLDRTRATTAGIEAFFNNPFLATTNMPLSSINMVAGIALTGAPWFLLMLAYMASPVLHGGMRRWQTYAGGFILVTMLTSQPLYGSTSVMILVIMLLSSIRRDVPTLGGDMDPVTGGRAAETYPDRRVVGGKRGNGVKSSPGLLAPQRLQR